MFDKHKGSKSGVAEEPVASYNPPPPAPSAPVPSSTGKVAIIGPGIVVDGDISGDENLLIEGRVKGSVKLASNEVSVGRNGVVEANVTAKTIKIAGKVTGDLKGSERVVISGTGHVRGNVVAPRVALEDGAIFKGSIDMDPGESVSKSAAPKSAPAPELVSSSGSSGSAVSKAPDLALKSG